MEVTRRGFLEAGAAGSFLFLGGGEAGAAPAQPRILKRKPALVRMAPRTVSVRIGAMDGVLGVGGASALEAAKRAGLDGVEADAGGTEDTLRICRPETIEEYRKAKEATGVVVSSICMGLLNGSPLISEPRAPGWVSAVIDAASALGAKTILLAFFGNGELGGQADRDKAAAIVRDLAQKAAEKGVTLGIENTLSAADNLALLEKAGNPPGLKVYYDIGNSTHYGYDVPAEIRALGDRICQIHFKDYKSGLLGKGEVKMQPVAESVAAIGYEGWIVLETGAPLGKELSAAANGAYIRGLFTRWTER